MKTCTFIVVVLCAAVCLAQTGKKRVSGGTASKPPTVREEIEELRKQVRELTATVKKLQQDVAELRKTTVATAPEDKVKQPKRRLRNHGTIATGMTLEEVEAIAGVAGELVSDVEGVKTYKWTLSNSRQIVESVEPEQLGSYTVFATFRDDKLVSYRRAEGGGGSARQVR